MFPFFFHFLYLFLFFLSLFFFSFCFWRGMGVLFLYFSLFFGIEFCSFWSLLHEKHGMPTAITCPSPSPDISRLSNENPFGSSTILCTWLNHIRVCILSFCQPFQSFLTVFVHFRHGKKLLNVYDNNVNTVLLLGHAPTNNCLFLMASELHHTFSHVGEVLFEKAINLHVRKGLVQVIMLVVNLL